MSITWLLVVACAVVYASGDRGGSSLRGALEALQRRQRGRIHGPVIQSPDYEALYEFVPPQTYPDPDYAIDIEDIEDNSNPKYMVKLLDANENPPENYEYKLIKKKNMVNTGLRKESAFRERSHHTDNDKLRDLFVGKSEDDDKKNTSEMTKSDEEYALLLGQLWSKYKYNKAHASDLEAAPQGVVKLYKDKIVKKRYPENWGPVAFKRKRSSDSDSNRPILSDYETRKQDDGTVNLNYNGYEIPDDDKDDVMEEYAIAFQPLEDSNLSDRNDEDLYAYDIEKRFPVTKRSSGPYDFGTQKTRFSQNQNKRDTTKSFRSSSGTDPKIIKDLSKIFGDSELDIIKSPVKRNSDYVESPHDVKPPTAPVHHNNTHQLNLTNHDEDSHEHHGHNIHHPGISGQEIEHDHEHYVHNHDHTHEDNHKNSHDQEQAMKPAEKPIILKKKSIDWSDYFGIDKRTNNQISHTNDLTQDRLRKQYFDTFNKEIIYPLNSFRKHNYVKRNFVQPKLNEETEVQIDKAQALAVENDNKRNTKDNESKLDNIDKKLRNMEGLIVDEALRYSNVGEKLDSKEEQEMKEQLLSRLAAAHSLEKMRKALKEFKQSLQTQKSESMMSSVISSDEAKSKRVAVKKELVNNNDIPALNKEDRNSDFEEEQGAGHYVNGKMEEFSEGYMGGSGRHRVPVISTGGPTGSCPVLAKIVQRCHGVDLLAGDRGQLFLPLCSLHQICYLCNEVPPTSCDLVFLSEADTTCDGDMSCQRASRAALMALRELHDSLADELDGECEASPCLPATLKLNLGWQKALQR